jgi:hypothetical protein
MKIIDNFLPVDLFCVIRDSILSVEFPWYWCNTKIKYKDNESLYDEYNYQFTHTFFEFNEKLSNFNINPILDALQVNALVRAKVNLTPNTPTIMEYGYHIDNDINCNTAIFYINTNNGYTKFKNGDIVNSIENRIVIFDSNILHSGTTCTDEKRRVVLNLNYF